jgi:hypothetical protein
MTTPGVDLDILLEDLAHTKQRLYKVEIQQECIINFLRATLSKDKAELFDTYLRNALSDDPVEIPTEAKAMMKVLRALNDYFKDYYTKRAIQNFMESKPCREDPLNAKGGVHV